MKLEDGRSISAKRFAQEFVWKAYLEGKENTEMPKTDKQKVQVNEQLEKVLLRVRKLLKVEEFSK